MTKITCKNCGSSFDGLISGDALYLEDRVIAGFIFKITCQSSPEQYDVFKNGKQVAYVRLRWGRLTVESPDCGGELIFEAPITEKQRHPDYGFVAWAGDFMTEKQREVLLDCAAIAIHNHINKPTGF